VHYVKSIGSVSSKQTRAQVKTMKKKDYLDEEGEYIGKNVVAEEITWLGYGLMRRDQRIPHVREETRTCVTVQLEVKGNKKPK